MYEESYFYRAWETLKVREARKKNKDLNPEEQKNPKKWVINGKPRIYKLKD